jgi:hypothetical protein
VGAETVPCQCGQPGCQEQLQVPAAARVGGHGLRAVAPGHVGDGDVVVRECDGYWLVRVPDAGDDPSALSFPASDPPPGPGSV